MCGDAMQGGAAKRQSWGECRGDMQQDAVEVGAARRQPLEDGHYSANPNV